MGCAVEVQGPAPIAGGFVLVPVTGLMAAWAEGRGGLLTRAYLALLEIRARRCRIGQGRVAACSHAELAGLLGVTPKKARALARRLEAAGLLAWDDRGPVFAQPEAADVEDLRDTIGGGLGSVMIPRRILRHLAAGARPALIATALGILLRCLSRRREGFDSRGRVKAAWIARTFGVALSRVKAARAELIALGWITPEPADQWAMNRWGRAYRVRLDWAAPAGSPVGPPSDVPGSPLGPPDLHQDLPSGNDNDQEPASGGPAGARLGDRGPERPGATPVVIAAPPVPAAPMLTGPTAGSPGFRPPSRPSPAPTTAPAIPTAPPPPPRLADVRIEDLEDTARLLELHRQAVSRGAITDSEADRLHVVAAAEHALEVGKSNPCGLFAYLIRGRLWRFITQGNEDRANLRIKAHLRGPALPSVTMGIGRPSSRPVLSEDAQVALRVRAGLATAGFRGDPYPQVRRHDPSWTRERWDAALSELETGGAIG